MTLHRDDAPAVSTEWPGPVVRGKQAVEESRGHNKLHFRKLIVVDTLC